MKKLHLLILLIGVIFFSISFTVMAQSQQPSAILQYFDDPTQITVTDAGGNSISPYYGLQLQIGDSIQTQSSTAEIQLSPNGSILKLADNTNFTVQTLQGVNNQTANAFQLAAGTVRTIAARTQAANYNYSFQTPTAVCGVRGTDFTLQVVPGKTDAVGVLAGQVSFIDTTTGKSIEVGAGNFANTFAATFAAVQMNQDQFNQLFKQMSFEKLVPSSVPGHSTEQQAAPPTEVTPPPPQTSSAQPAAPAKPAPLSPFMQYLRDNLGMEIGTITVDGVTYSKAVIQPQINAGKFRMQLYLPVIYSSDLFNPSDWYHPAGNNEWSFGSDASFGTDTLARAKDFATDLFLKIRYLEWGSQRDPFYIKLGNLSDMTIGHGLLMSNFANDQNFPAIREVGLNMGIDLGGFGLETVVDNLGDPAIFGGRLYTRPFGTGWLRPAFGVSGIADWNPAVESGSPDFADPSDVGEPIFIAVGTDVDLPIVQTDPLAIVAFGDLGGMIPYFRNAFTTANSTDVGAGLDYSILTYRDSAGGIEFRNYGLEAGLLGNVSIVNWRLSYRNYYGIFQPSFFNSTYNRRKAAVVRDLVEYLNDPTASQYQSSTSGIYGEAGVTIGKVASFEAGYLWPWSPSGDPSGADFLHLRLDLKRGIIPNFGISASLSYDRTNFIPTLLSNSKTAAGLTLFDANTTLQAEVDYPIAPALDIAAIVTTSVEHDAGGNVIYNDATGLPSVKPSVSIETRVHF